MRTVIVTGGSSGIGAATAARFLSLGDRVYSADVQAPKAASGTVAVGCDVTDPAAVEALVGRVLDETGRLDVMVNNAGVRATGDVRSTSLAEWERVMAVNATGVFLGCKYAVAPMLAQASGSIVNVASMAGLTPMYNRAAYCASKGAVIALTRQVALQYAGKGVRANAVCPGPTLTEFVGEALASVPDKDAALAAYADRQPVKRLGRPEEIAAAITYLCSPEAGFVTGVALEIDGGVSLVNSM